MRTRISVLSVLVLAGAAYAQPTSYFTGFEQGDGFFAGPTRTVGSMAFPQAAGPGGTLHPVQQAWLDLCVPQCGYC
ncbi:MAG: hypothetical protein K2Q09_08055, partial [Phycisphaerales bacterium]|nr:hypothetical protein [Phycisphaerales bacterium]